MLLKLPHETKREGMLANSFYEASGVTLMPKLDNRTKKKIIN
jgi:hypothetical protein